MEGRIVHVEGDVLHVESANGQEYVLSVDLINSIQPSKDTESAPELVAIIEKVQLAAAQRAKQAQAEKAQKTVELYMTEWCPYCRKMEQYLRQNRVRYHRYDIDRDREALKRYRRMGGRGVPVVRIGDDVIHGYNTDAVRKALRL
jgi:glutaredoxin